MRTILPSTARYTVLGAALPKKSVRCALCRRVIRRDAYSVRCESTGEVTLCGSACVKRYLRADAEAMGIAAHEQTGSPALYQHSFF